MEGSPSEANNHATRPNAIRASKACARCNHKRVKCDVVKTGLPCSRCQRSGSAECVLIDSRRGKYPRKKSAALSKAAAARTSRQHEGNDETVEIDNAAWPRQDSQVRDQSEDPEAAVASLNGVTDLSPASRRADDVASYREMSWATMFNHFLDTRQTRRQDAIDKCSITYLGESFPLALVLEDLREGGKTRLHHPGPPLDPGDGTPTSNHVSTHPTHLSPEDVRLLEAKKVFVRPRRELLDALIDVCLNHFFVLYPLVTREEFQDQYKADSLPWILLHACCFVATTFCSDELIHRTGFSNRKEARFAYYRKAKALFDAEYEGNKIVVLQSVIMLTFWGGKPNDYWNTWTWQSTAVGLAETLGIHRSTAGTNMSLRDRSLLKRLWWTLVIRDASCATLVGRPFRINMEHGDAEMLTIEDFESDTKFLHESGHPLASTFAHYQVEIAKLSLLLYDIDYARFIPGQKKVSMEQVYYNLQVWRNELPSAIDWDIDSPGTNILATCLSMIYDHHMMLANLGTTPADTGATSTVDLSRNSDNNTGFAEAWPTFSAELAAQRISTSASSIVTRSQAFAIPHETYQAVFMAGVVSYVSMRSTQTTLSQLGRVILDNCRMILHHVRDAWDAAPWTMALFDGLTSSLGKPIDHHADGGITMPAVRTPTYGFIGDIDEALSGYGFGGSWQSNPMLSALFDTSQAMESF
jgi:hypothetical protein